MDAPPLLSADHARVAVDDVIAIEDLTVTSRGDRVVLAGDVTVLFAAISGVPLLATAPGAAPGESALAGEARVVSGELRVAGLDVAEQAHLAVAGFAPLDPPVPRSMTALKYAAWAARLAGARPRAAEEMAMAALRRVGLEALSGRNAATLGPAERRALQIAKAIAHGPAVLVAEAPLDRLDGAAAAFVAGALEAAASGRRALLSVKRVDPATAEGALARGADHLVFLGERGVVAEGRPRELLGASRVYRLTVTANVDALREALASRGVELRAGPVHFTAALPEGKTTAALLEAASEARAPVVEIAPLAG